MSSSDATPQRPSPDDRGIESTGEITASNTEPPVLRRTGRASSNDHVQRRYITGNGGDRSTWHGTAALVSDHDLPPLHRAGYVYLILLVPLTRLFGPLSIQRHTHQYYLAVTSSDSISSLALSPFASSPCHVPTIRFFSYLID